MKKLIVVLLVFFAGHYFGNVVIGASKAAYHIVAAEVQKAAKWGQMFEIVLIIGIWFAVLGVVCLYDEFKKEYSKKSVDKD